MQPVVLLAGAAENPGAEIACAVLAAGGKVAAAVTRGWQVEKLRDRLLADGIAIENLLVGVVGPRDMEAAAGFVKGASDALGSLTHFAGASLLLRDRLAGLEPAGDLDELLDVNLHTNATLARAVLPGMRRRKSGTLVFVECASCLASLSATCKASLAGLDSFQKALHDDVQVEGVRVNAIPAPVAGAESMIPWMRAFGVVPSRS
jgi:3-oxoacyl-[acyl-carrier protein] reductase